MTFAYPWVLLGLPCLFLWTYFLWKQKRPTAVQYPSVAPVRAASRSWLSILSRMPLFLRTCMLALMLLAVARPQFVEREVRKSSEGLDIVLVIDTSGSMNEGIAYQGQWVSRLAATKAVVKTFVSQRVDDRIGLVVFGNDAFTQAPLTLDHDVLSRFIDNIYLKMAGQGTAIGSGIITGVKRIKDLDSKSKIMILLTDGADTGSTVSPLAAADVARELGIKIYTVGVGSRRSVDADTLQSIAARTKGQFFLASTVESLAQVYNNIDQLEKSEQEVKDFSRYHEKYGMFLFPCLILFLFDLVFHLSRWRVLA